MTTVRIIGAFFLLSVITTPAVAKCPPDWLQIEAHPGDGSVEFFAVNNGDSPVTFTLDFNTRRYTAPRELQITESLSARESRSVLTLHRADQSRRGYYHYNEYCTVGRRDADHDDDVIYRLPYASGRSYQVLQGYGSSFSHTGREAYAVDFYMREGTPVHAARGGVVAMTEERHSIGCWEDGCGRYANFIVIVHDDDTTGEYYHLQQDGVLVESGQRVEPGDLIGLSGNTGHTTMPHLHFGVYRAVKWGREQSIPVRFRTDKGILDRPRSGRRYYAVDGPQYIRSADMGGERFMLR